MVHVLGFLLGGAAGFVIGRYLSRLGFGCPLVCDPRISTIYFALIGLFVTFN